MRTQQQQLQHDTVICCKAILTGHLSPLQADGLNRHISCCNLCTQLQRCSTFCARILLSSGDQFCHGVIRVQSENVQPTLCECSITSVTYGPTSLMFHSTSAALTCLSSVKRSLRLTLLSKRLQTCQCLQNPFEQSCHHEHDCCTCSSQMASKDHWEVQIPTRLSLYIKRPKNHRQILKS